MTGPNEESSKMPLTNNSLNLIRLLYLTYFLAIGCIQPFLSVYYHSLGFSGTQIGLIGSISPFASFVVAPFWGRLSDKSESPFPVLYLTSAISVVGTLLLYFFRDVQQVMIIVCITALFEAPVKPLIDSLVVSSLKDRSQFGKLRLFALIGMGFATSVMGRYLKDGYQLLFFAYALMHLPFFLCVRFFQMSHKGGIASSNKSTSSPKPFKDVIATIFQKREWLMLFSVIYLLGMSSALGDNFIYVRIKEQGGTGKHMGLSRLISSVGGAFMFFNSGSIFKILGMDWILAASFLGFALRFAIAYSMKTISHGYLAESLRGIIYGCFWPSSTVYASHLAPPDAQGTMVRVFCFLVNAIIVCLFSHPIALTHHSSATIVEWGLQWDWPINWIYNCREVAG